MKKTILDRFEQNLKRVAGLLELYEDIAGPGPGRRPTDVSDVLRAAVVLLHATLEDLVRSVLEWRLPKARPAVLAAIPLPAKGKKTKHDLGDVAEYRGQSVDELIADAVQKYLLQSNFNDVGQIASVLDDVEVGGGIISEADKTTLTAMMKRRHWIVHRLDVNQAQGSGQHAAQSLGGSQVRAWMAAVERVGNDVLAAVAED